MMGILLACLFWSTSGWAAEEETIRIALVAAANDGGTGRIPLRYALSDAQSLSSVLVDLGGVGSEDITTLSEPSVDRFAEAMTDLRALVAMASEANHRTEVFVYYSGHSDENGLLLGGDHYAFSEFRSQLENMGADVTVAIVDSCSSGALIRSKGGVPVQAFLIDESTAVEGLAVLTSSSADEASQESDRLGGSFFTQALVTALRGAGDADGDLQVTIGEAYRYAYDDTLARTESTSYGAQHPNWDIDLKGTGALVLSDMRVAETSLVVDAGRSGRLSVRDSHEHLVLELGLDGTSSPELALPAGSYTVRIERTDHALRSDVTLAIGETLSLIRADFMETELESTRARGADFQHQVTGAAWYPDLSPTAPSLQKRHNLSFGLVGHRAARLDGLGLALGYSAFDAGLSGFQLGLFVARSGGSTSGVQLSGGVAFTRGRMMGLQLGAVAIAPEVRGVQFAGFSETGEIRGVQLGLVNIAGSVSGGQVGVINIASRVNGVQVGLVNVATKRSGASVGAVNIASDGFADFELWSDLDPGLNVGAKFGSRGVYSAYAAGLTTDLSSKAGVGLGGRISTGVVELDIDSFVAGRVGPAFDESIVSVEPGLRLALGLRVTEQFAPFVGVYGYFVVPVLGAPTSAVDVGGTVGASGTALAGVRF